jgi:hypothetical protein
VTFCDFCQSPDTEQDNPDHTICHLVSPGENDRVWWIGFDCVHLGDLSPRYPGTGRYRNQKYVEREVEKLAQQLKEMMAT